jgi:hypothetical protein
MTTHVKNSRFAIGVMALGIAASASAGMYTPAAREQRADRHEQREQSQQQQPQQQAAPQQQSQPRNDRGDRSDRSDRGNRGEGAGQAPSQRRTPPAESNTTVPDRRTGGNFRNGNRGSVVNVPPSNAPRIDGRRDNHGYDRIGRRGDRVSRPGHYPAPRYVQTLPHGHSRHNWNGSNYYQYGGSWYRPYGNRYLAVGAPYGLFMSYLPSYHSSFWFGSSRYFFADNTYYTYEPTRRGYTVSRSPYGDDNVDDYDGNQQDDDLYIYPARGQSQQQQEQDRYECHRWAADESDYDPTDSQYDSELREDYDRAITACLTGRGYSVR